MSNIKTRRAVGCVSCCYANREELYLFIHSFIHWIGHHSITASEKIQNMKCFMGRSQKNMIFLSIKGTFQLFLWTHKWCHWQVNKQTREKYFFVQRIICWFLCYLSAEALSLFSLHSTINEVSGIGWTLSRWSIKWDIMWAPAAGNCASVTHLIITAQSCQLPLIPPSYF